MKIDSINNYIGSDIFLELVDELYLFSSFLDGVYPKYKDWFYNKQIKGCVDGKRNILFIREEHNRIIAICNLKKTDDEKKLCTLYVLEEYRKKGIGKSLLLESFNYLGTTRPFVTILFDNLYMFEGFIKDYNWVLSFVLGNEYYFNK